MRRRSRRLRCPGTRTRSGRGRYGRTGGRGRRPRLPRDPTECARPVRRPRHRGRPARAALSVFAEMVHDRLETADWPLRRDIVRTLVKRIEVTNDVVRIVFRGEPGSPEPLTALPHCQTDSRSASHAARRLRVPLVGKGSASGMSSRQDNQEIRRAGGTGSRVGTGCWPSRGFCCGPGPRIGMTASLTSRGQRFRHHHAAADADADRGENHDPTGITIRRLRGSTEGLIRIPP